MDQVIEGQDTSIEEVREKGYLRWHLEKENRKFETGYMAGLAANYQMRFDREIHERQQRKVMQEKMQKTHTGEDRWTNIDNYCIELISSGCAIVGMFVGYSVARAKPGDLCTSRQHDAETSVDWLQMPPLCRPDDVDKQNAAIELRRQEAEQKKQRAASGSGGARGSGGASGSGGARGSNDAQGSGDEGFFYEEDPEDPVSNPYNVDFDP